MLYEESTNCLNLSKWLSSFAHDTWHRIAFFKHTERNYLFETTITQNLVYELIKWSLHESISLSIFEAKDEKVNGNDLEIIIQNEETYLLFPCQAKIVGKNEIYNTFNHRNKKGHQIELLLDYASKIKGIPIYFLYNFSNDIYLLKDIESTWQIPRSSFGVSFLTANYLLSNYCTITVEGITNIINPTFKQIHHNHIALPLEVLPLLNTTQSFREFLNRGFPEPWDWNTIDLSNFALKELPESWKWKELTSKAAIGKIETDYSNKIIPGISNENPFSFAPAYRIVFNLSTPPTQLLRMY